MEDGGKGGKSRVLPPFPPSSLIPILVISPDSSAMLLSFEIRL